MTNAQTAQAILRDILDCMGDADGTVVTRREVEMLLAVATFGEDVPCPPHEAVMLPLAPLLGAFDA